MSAEVREVRDDEGDQDGTASMRAEQHLGEHGGAVVARTKGHRVEQRSPEKQDGAELAHRDRKKASRDQVERARQESATSVVRARLPHADHDVGVGGCLEEPAKVGHARLAIGGCEKDPVAARVP